jgi:hypothetical protein
VWEFLGVTHYDSPHEFFARANAAADE